MGKKANLRDVMAYALTTGERLAFALGALYHGALNNACGEHAINDVNEQTALVLCHLDKDSVVTCKPAEAGEAEAPAEKKDESPKEKVPVVIEEYLIPPRAFLDILKILSATPEECGCPKCVAVRAERKTRADGDKKPEAAVDEAKTPEEILAENWPEAAETPSAPENADLPPAVVI